MKPIRTFVIRTLFALAALPAALNQLASAQTAAALAPVAMQQFLDTATGAALPCQNCTLSTFAAGTSTPLATYTDSTGTTQNPVVITLNSQGYSTSGIWVGSTCYKFILADAVGSPVWSQDNICDSAQLASAALAGTGGAALVGFQQSGGNLTTIAAMLNTFVYDSGFSSFAAACTQAANVHRKLALTQTWNGLATQTCAADIQPAGGMIQPAASAVVSLSGASTPGSNKQWIDTSLGGAGSVIFTGIIEAARAEWFGYIAGGADSASTPTQSQTLAAQNTLAIQSALWAFPAIPTLFAGNSSGSMRVPVRPGRATIGCGSAWINGTIYIAGYNQALGSTCPGGSNVWLANGSFTSSEKMMVEVLPMEFTGTTPIPNSTFNVQIDGNIQFNANGANNSMASGVKMYGAEQSYFNFVSLGASLRACIIGDTIANDSAFWYVASDHVMADLECSGLSAATGPSLYYHCTNCIVRGNMVHSNQSGSNTGAVVPGGTGTLAVTAPGGNPTVTWTTGGKFSPTWAGRSISIASNPYVITTVSGCTAVGFNPAESCTVMTLATQPTVATGVSFTFTGVVNPQIWVDGGENAYLENSYGDNDCEQLFAEVTNSSRVTFHNASLLQMATGCPTNSGSAVNIEANNLNGIEVAGIVGGYTNSIHDYSTATGLGGLVQAALGGAPSTTPFSYNNNVQMSGQGIAIGNATIITPQYGNAVTTIQSASTSNPYSTFISCVAGQAICGGFANSAGQSIWQFLNNGTSQPVGAVIWPTYTFATIPAAYGTQRACCIWISDATVNTWGAAITAGGGSDNVLADWNGTWNVIGK
jgi:hypothetical protein